MLVLHPIPQHPDEARHPGALACPGAQEHRNTGILTGTGSQKKFDFQEIGPTQEHWSSDTPKDIKIWVTLRLQYLGGRLNPWSSDTLRDIRRLAKLRLQYIGGSMDCRIVDTLRIPES